MELLSPAGTGEKARVAFRYGADAVYIGIPGLSLRAGAEPLPDPDQLWALKEEFPRGRVYGAVNRFFHQRDLAVLKDRIPLLRELPLDALIISDPGLVETIREGLPEMELHLSTQANCTNAAAARLYRALGFSRIVAARELTLAEISEIHDAVPDLEIELFVHGAMCMAYSGRCFLSREMSNRSANAGDCAHSCRWHYAVVEEKRPGEYYPVEAGAEHTAIFSARDLMLLDDLNAIHEAGVTAIKIEGRMKSALYTAVTTRAYRAALDGEPCLHQWRSELFTIPHRPYTRGFLVSDESVHDPALEASSPEYRLMGVIGRLTETDDAASGPIHAVDVRNSISRDDTVDILLPDGTIVPEQRLDLRDETGAPLQKIVRGKPAFLALPETVRHMDAELGMIRARPGHRDHPAEATAKISRSVASCR